MLGTWEESRLRCQNLQAEMDAAIEEEQKKVAAAAPAGDLAMGMGDDNTLDFMEVEPRSHPHPARSKRRR